MAVKPLELLARMLAVAVAAALAAGCSLLDSVTEAVSGEEATPPEPPVVLVVVPGKVTGGKGKEVKDLVRQEAIADIGPVVDEFVTNAFLGDYPRTDFSAAFATFTPGAAAKAEADADLLSGAGFVGAATVEPISLNATIESFAPKGELAGATATLDLEFEVDGSPVSVTGRLLLSKEDTGWKVFGYDVSKEGAEPMEVTEQAGAEENQ